MDGYATSGRILLSIYLVCAVGALDFEPFLDETLVRPMEGSKEKRTLKSQLHYSKSYGQFDLQALALVLLALNPAVRLPSFRSGRSMSVFVRESSVNTPMGNRCKSRRAIAHMMGKTKPKTKKGKTPSKSTKGGFGISAPKTRDLAEITLPGAGLAVEQALTAKANALVKAPKDAQAWLELGAVLIKAREYAEAERVFRAAAAAAPDMEICSSMALSLGGDSKFYYQGSPEARPRIVSASLLPQLHSTLSDEGFDAFAMPPDHIYREDLSMDRASDWGPDAVTRGVVFQSKHPVLSPSECAWVIEQVEKQAEHQGGWTTSRHVQAPTTDFPMKQVPAIHEWFNRKLQDELFPMIHARYPTLIASPDEIRVHDAFIVRYDAGKQASLPVHTDHSTISLTIALNDHSEYEGGGVIFPSIRPVDHNEGGFVETILNADSGGVVIFPGKVPHGGNTVTKGRRYIIPLFLYLDVNYSGKKPGWLLKQLNFAEASPEADAALDRFAKMQVKGNSVAKAT